MDNLLSELEVGIMPHYMIPRTLGSMANANVYGVVPYLKDIFNNILPLLGGLRNDALKQSFSFGKYIQHYAFKIFYNCICLTLSCQSEENKF